MPGDVHQLIVPLLAPILERVFVKQVDVLGDLRLPQHLLVLLRRGANHPGHQGRGGRQMVRGQRQSFCIERCASVVPVA